MLLVMLVVKESSLVVVLGLKPDSPAHRKPHGGLSSSGARRNSPSTRAQSVNRLFWLKGFMMLHAWVTVEHAGGFHT